MGSSAAVAAGRAGPTSYLWLALVLALVGALQALWSWTDQLGGFGNDGPYYLMMAQHYSPYRAADTIYTQSAALSRFPPLYPLLLAWSGAAADLHLAHFLTSLFLLAGLGAYCAWLRVQGAAVPQAALLALLLGVLPATWRLSLSVQSEFLYLFFSLSALALLAAYEVQRLEELLYVAALAVSAAVLTRSIGVALYAPLALVLLHSRRRAAGVALAAAVLPVLLWHLLHRASYGYAGVVTGTYGGHWLEALRQQLAQELPALRSGFESDLSDATPAARLAADLLGVAGLAALLWRAASRKPDAVYVAAYAVITLLWPFPTEAWRFAWVVLPLWLVQPLLLLAEARREPAAGTWPQRATAALAAALLALLLPALAEGSARYLAAPYCGVPQARGLTAWYDPAPAAQNLYQVYSDVVITAALRRIRDEVPPGACVIAIRPDLVNYFGVRRSAFTPLNSVPDPLFLMAMHATGCHYVFMSSGTIKGVVPPLHPLQRLGGQLRVLDYVDTPVPPPGSGRVTSILAELP